MDPLEIKADSPEFVVDVFHNFSDNGVNDQNQEYDDDPLDITNEHQPEFITNDCESFGEHEDKNDNQENGDYSSELTLISVSFSTNYHYVHDFFSQTVPIIFII